MLAPKPLTPPEQTVQAREPPKSPRGPQARLEIVRPRPAAVNGTHTPIRSGRPTRGLPATRVALRQSWVTDHSDVGRQRFRYLSSVVALMEPGFVVAGRERGASERGAAAWSEPDVNDRAVDREGAERTSVLITHTQGAVG